MNWLASSLIRFCGKLLPLILPTCIRGISLKFRSIIIFLLAGCYVTLDDQPTNDNLCDYLDYCRFGMSSDTYRTTLAAFRSLLASLARHYPTHALQLQYTSVTATRVKGCHCNVGRVVQRLNTDTHAIYSNCSKVLCLVLRLAYPPGYTSCLIVPY